jgi:DNA-binding CsgD family transcriptional regulator
MPMMAAHLRAAGLLVEVGRGDPAAQARLDWAKPLSERLGTHVMLGVTVAAAEIDLAGWAGDAETAVRRADEASRRLAEVWPIDRLAALRLLAMGLSAAADAAAAARLVGDRSGADRWVAAGQPLAVLAEESVTSYASLGPSIGPEARAWRARVAAELERLAGRAVPELWQVAADAFVETGHVYELARTRWRLAEALVSVDRRDEAAVELRAAHEVAVQLSATPLRTAVEALARRARLDIGAPGTRPAEVATVFTPREAEVLTLMAQGRTNKQIGAALFISEKTASVHVSNILGKLAAGSRTEAVAVAAERGLLAQLTR